jgi:peptidoglycan hydrolase-like protein with peptidoglycan-binding domain
MKHSLTAVLAIVSAAGLAGIAQAQTTTQPAATPAPGAETTAPNTQYQSSTAPATPSAAQPTTATAAPRAAPQANMQQSSGNDFWSRNLSQDEIRQAQQQLAAQGLYRGPVDGLAGPEMQRALARFQQQNRLRRTGTLDPDTMNRLASNAPAGNLSTSPTGPAVGASTPPASNNAPIGAGGNTTAPTAPNPTEGQPLTR